jgi:Na+-transporting NADH:ubiquinone oxidoreductase subunit NqrB
MKKTEGQKSLDTVPLSVQNTNWQSWAFATFSPIRYMLFRYFNTSFRYRYFSENCNTLLAIATFVSSVLRTASILGLYLR